MRAGPEPAGWAECEQLRQLLVRLHDFAQGAGEASMFGERGRHSLEPPGASELAAGELAAGELAAGELATGELAAGELATGVLATGARAARVAGPVGASPVTRVTP